MQSGVGDPPTSLLDLPHSLILSIMQQMDMLTLCTVSRCCRALHQLSSHPLLWPAQHAASQWAVGDVRLTLANILKLPPQVFNAQLDVRRSRRFPVYVGMHNLRPILAISDAEGLAERVSRALQDKLLHLQHNLWRYDSWQELPPAASISVCRADGASIRAGLRPQAVVPHLVAQLQQLGWPPDTPPGLNAAPSPAGSSDEATSSQIGSTSGTTNSPDSGSSRNGTAAGAMPLPAGLVQVLQVCQQCMNLLHTGQVLQQLRGAALGQKAGGLRASTPAGAGAAPAGAAPACQWQPNMKALHSVADRLPDESTARACAASLLSQHGGAGTAAAQSLAVRLFWASLIADPGLLLYAPTRGKAAQWHAPLSAAARVVAKLHTLMPQGITDPSTGSTGGAAGQSSAMPAVAEEDARASNLQAVWRAAAQAELQLCQSGLEQLLVAVSEHHNPSCQPGPIYRCIQALDAAVTEYISAHGGSSQQVLPMMQLLRLSAGQPGDVARTLQAAMHMSVLRALHWCLWLLGCW